MFILHIWIKQIGYVSKWWKTVSLCVVGQKLHNNLSAYYNSGSLRENLDLCTSSWLWCQHLENPSCTGGQSQVISERVHSYLLLHKCRCACTSLEILKTSFNGRKPSRKILQIARHYLFLLHLKQYVVQKWMCNKCFRLVMFYAKRVMMTHNSFWEGEWCVWSVPAVWPVMQSDKRQQRVRKVFFFALCVFKLPTAALIAEL